MIKFTSPLKKGLFAIALLLGQIGFSQIKTTISDGDWNDPAIWSPTGVPDFLLSVDSLIVKHAVDFSGTLFIFPGVENFKVEFGKSLSGTGDSDSLYLTADHFLNQGTISTSFLLLSDSSLNDGAINGRAIKGSFLANNGELRGDSLILDKFVNNDFTEMDYAIILGDSLVNGNIMRTQGELISGTYFENSGEAVVMKSATINGVFINQASAYFEIGDSLRSNSLLENNGQVMAKHFFNFDKVTGEGGSFCIAENFMNIDTIVGTVDICDATPLGVIDVSIFTGPSVTFCAVEPCMSPSANLDELQQQNKVLIYPNPIKDHFTINISNQTEVLQFTLFDLKGRLLFSQEIINGELSIGDLELEKDMYYYEIIGQKNLIRGQLLFLN